MQILTKTPLAAGEIPGIEHATLAGSDDGLKSLSVWQQSIAPGAATPPHRHDCEEVVLVEAGRGEIVIDGQVRKFEAGTTLVIPRNVDHQIFSTGGEPLRTTAIFGMTPVEVFFPDGQPLALPWRS